MGQFIRLLVLGIVVVLILYACNLFSNRSETPPQGISGELTPVRLTIQAVNANEAFNRVGQIITYSYVVTNTGNTPLAGPATITDNKVTGITCPAVDTVGNLNNFLDLNENVTCTGTYSITQDDLNAGSVTNNATATVGGVASAVATATVRMAENKVLTLAKSASPMTYSQVGQVITYNYTINNTGATTLGPIQFIVRDDRISAPINCGPATTTLATNQTVTCTATYTITQNDMAVAQLTNSATASGGSAGSIQPATVSITNMNPPSTPGTPSSLPRGSTIQHKVVEGEWMLQVARCYGADFTAVRNANPQVVDPDLIFPFPGTTLTVPNIGSTGTIYGPPCVVFHTVQAGDTWNSIAQKYNADLAVLQEANKGAVLSNGVKLKIPINSAGSNVTPPPITQVPTTPAPTTGAERVADINTGPGNSDPAYLAVFNGALYFRATGSDNAGAELWKYDSTLKAASRVADINAGAVGSNPSYLTDFNSALYFNANGNDGAGIELWRYNSSAAGRLTDINAGSGDSNPTHLAVFKDALYFSATSNDGAGTELWKYDGTTATRVSDISAGVGNSNPAFLEGYGGLLYFSANANDGFGTELWKYDGTNPPTRAADINTGAGDSAPTFMTDFNGALYFGAIGNDGAGYELWKFDGTTATRVTDINKAGNSNPAYLAVYNDELYFQADGGGGAGIELWKFRP